jgi:MOSC domain-containing protein YiiM
MAGEIVTINIKARHGDPALPTREVLLVVGVGIADDRYAGADGGVISLIEEEAIAAFNHSTGLAVTAAETGRNVATHGIRLTELLGRRFALGDAVLECFELCEPCASLGKRLATREVSAAAVVKGFTHTAGIRARVIEGGTITSGTPIAPILARAQ